VDAVIIEVEERRIWDDQWLASTVYEKMASHGLIAVARDAEYKVQYNVVFVRKELVGRVKPQLVKFFDAIRTL
jgi:hypothetical protein